MTHPEELLSDYADGALDPAQRAVVEAHLAGCGVCREEIELAGRAKTALAALEDRPVPFGVTGPIVAEAGRRFERRRGVVWERLQWATGLAAAAALVLVVALNLSGSDSPNVANLGAATAGGATGSAPEAADAQAPSRLAFLGLEKQPDVDYDDEGIRAVAVEMASQIVSAEGGGSQALAGASQTLDDATGAARRCVASSGLTNGPRDKLVRLIQAKYAGTPAYIAVFAEGPGADQPADHVVVWVVATGDCRILSTASQRI